VEMCYDPSLMGDGSIYVNEVKLEAVTCDSLLGYCFRRENLVDFVLSKFAKFH